MNNATATMETVRLQDHRRKADGSARSARKSKEWMRASHFPTRPKCGRPGGALRSSTRCFAFAIRI